MLMTGSALETKRIQSSRATHAGAVEIGRRELSQVPRERGVRAAMLHAWRSVLDVRQQHALEFVSAITPEIDALEPRAAHRYGQQLHLIRAIDRVLSDDPERALVELDNLADNDRRDLAQVLRRFAYWRLGRWADLYALRGTGNGSRGSGTLARILDQTVLAAAAFERLHLVTASRFAADALELADRSGFRASIAAASAAVVLASVRYEFGYLDRAEELVLGHLSIIRTRGTPDVIIRAYSLLSRIARHHDQYEHSAFVLNEGQHLGEQRSCSRLVLSMMSERVSVLIARGAIARARKEASAMRAYRRAHALPAFVDEEVGRLCDAAEARVALAAGSADSAALAFGRMLRGAHSAGQTRTAFLARLELAGALSASGAHEIADGLLVRALRKGERVGALQCWIDACPAACVHLARAAARLTDAVSPALAPLGPYLRTVLAHLKAGEVATPAGSRWLQRASERLSARERAVLALVARGQSNKRVAQTLKVTPETVKSHLKRAFLKLGAKTRAEAVSRAADLGQLIGVVVPAASQSAGITAPIWGLRRAAASSNNR
jgi:LuxR family maltose regulon positive regulatory protein